MKYPKIYSISLETPKIFDGTAKAEVIIQFDSNIVSADILIKWDWKGDIPVVESWYSENYITEGDPFLKSEAREFLKKDICEVDLADKILDCVKGVGYGNYKASDKLW